MLITTCDIMQYRNPKNHSLNLLLHGNLKLCPVLVYHSNSSIPNMLVRKIVACHAGISEL
jgi:hypothetical protein